MEYDSIGKRIHVRADLSSLSGRDKVNLFKDLMDDLGITEVFQQYPDETAFAAEEMVKKWDKLWK